MYTDPSGLGPDYANGLSVKDFLAQYSNEVEILPLKGDVRVTTVPGSRELYYPRVSESTSLHSVGRGRYDVTTTTVTSHKRLNDHFGAYDFVPSQDDTVYAAASGIARSGYNDSLGFYIVIKQFNGNTTQYSHLQEIETGVSFEVKQGDPIGIVGSTGVSTGPHLDFRMLDSSNNQVDLIEGLVETNYTYDKRYIDSRPGADGSERFNIPNKKPSDIVTSRTTHHTVDYSDALEVK